MRIFLNILLYISSNLCFAQTWEVLPNYPGEGKDDALAFASEEEVFLVTGNNNGYSESQTLFVYTIATNSWETRTGFPGTKRQYAASFTLKNTFYIIGGYSEFGEALRDVWRYEPNEDSWQQLGDFPGIPRWSAVSFEVTNKGYYGTGTDGNEMLEDFWEYNPETDTWTRKSNFKGGPRREAVAASQLGTGVVGLGYAQLTTDSIYADIYRYYPQVDEWKQIADYPGGKTLYAEAGSNQQEVLIVGGMDENLQFTSAAYILQANDTWKTIETIPTGPIRGMSLCAVNSTIFVIAGLKVGNIRSNECYQWTLESQEIIPSVYPNPSGKSCTVTASQNSKVEIYSQSGQLVGVQEVSNTGSIVLELPHLGIYHLRVIDASTVTHLHFLQL